MFNTIDLQFSSLKVSFFFHVLFLFLLNSAWLRRRRNVPPAQEELDRNYSTMIRTQMRAKELEKTGGKASDADTNAEAPYTETVTQDSFNSKFPAYKDFETTPGQFRDKGKSQDG
eukprot:GHVL01032846.1.p1 GENE.GHVL01032846.1~~GHVL01032846.1.p1  ORF type:complete len:115 (+),score=9.74 GHVL01032846.1:73-417(+)